MKRFYTTGDIARYCEVDINTVKSWIRGNDLQAFTTPSGHYRIARNEFISFVRKQGFTYEPAYFGEDSFLTDFLIIEDNQDQRESLTYLIKELYNNVRIEMAQDGFEGYLKINQQKPKLVLLDAELPSLTSVELLRALRSHLETSQTKVIAFSERLDDGLLDEMNKIGVDGIILGPFDREKLKEKCDPFLGNANV